MNNTQNPASRMQELCKKGGEYRAAKGLLGPSLRASRSSRLRWILSPFDGLNFVVSTKFVASKSQQNRIRNALMKQRLSLYLTFFCISDIVSIRENPWVTSSVSPGAHASCFHCGAGVPLTNEIGITRWTLIERLLSLKRRPCKETPNSQSRGDGMSARKPVKDYPRSYLWEKIALNRFQDITESPPFPVKYHEFHRISNTLYDRDDCFCLSLAYVNRVRGGVVG